MVQCKIKKNVLYLAIIMSNHQPPFSIEMHLGVASRGKRRVKVGSRRRLLKQCRMLGWVMERGSVPLVRL